MVLIAWEHQLIPSIANMLAEDTSRVPKIWPDHRYDLAWVFTSTGQRGGIEFREVPQMLLAGDQPTPIGTTDPA